MPSSAGQRAYRHTYRWRHGLRQRVLKRDGYRCVFCGDPGTDGKGKGLTLAHIEDHALGGADNEGNVVTACRPCHGRIDGPKSRGGQGR